MVRTLPLDRAEMIHPSLFTGPIPELNVPLLNKTMDHIAAHPDEWDQESWGRIPREHLDAAMEGKTPCGTTMCFAGTALHLDGQQLAWDEMHESEDEDGVLLALHTANGKKIEEEARRLLGLTYMEARSLFHNMTHDPDVLRETVEAIVAGRTR